ncbi:unnamed protein product [Rotaria sp. Silwood2]|nr:unnamed protein product [Rotaria sp. Silwood2]
MFKSSSYLSYTQAQCANVTLNSIECSNLIIYMHLLDLNIDSSNPSTDECSNDCVLLSYQCNNQLYSIRLYDKIFASYNLLNKDSQSLPGFVLLYHLLPKTDRLTTSTTRSSTLPGSDTISTIIQQPTICVKQTVTIQRSMSEYVFVIHRFQLAANVTYSCTYSSKDCFEDLNSLYSTCSGRLSDSQPYKTFKIYILTLNLSTRLIARDQDAQCDENYPYFEINTADLGVTRLCGNSHARYLYDTCSNVIKSHYKNVNIDTSIVKYKGFGIYFESIKNDKCRSTLSTQPHTLETDAAYVPPTSETDTTYSLPTAISQTTIRTDLITTIKRRILLFLV